MTSNGEEGVYVSGLYILCLHRMLFSEIPFVDRPNVPKRNRSRLIEETEEQTFFPECQRRLCRFHMSL